MNGLLFKDGVLPIGHLARAGCRILAALDVVSRRVGLDLTVTCADGEHPPDDPHSLGEAYDVRTHDLTEVQKNLILRAVMAELRESGDATDLLSAVDGGLATHRFFGWIEHAGEPNEHIHIQRRKGTVY